MTTNAREVVLDEVFGRLNTMNRGTADAAVVSYLRYAPTGARPFLALADDGRNYWVKVKDNPHGNKTLANEYVVWALGMHIGAPMLNAALLSIPTELDGFTYCDEVKLREGVAFGSLHLASAVEGESVAFVKEDGNMERYPFMLALWDLCLGADMQVLYDTSKANQVSSFDHGLWFSSDEGDWDADVLTRLAEGKWHWPAAPLGLSGRAFHEAADALTDLSLDDTLNIVSGVPLEWEIQSNDLEALAWFVAKRAPIVATRLRQAAQAYS
jgi:hypothetical protein